MNDKKTNGSFSKVRKLITILQKSNGKGAVGGSDALISPKAAKILLYCGLFVLTCALLAGMCYIQPFAARFFSLRGVTQALMMMLLILSFVLAVKDAVTVLYTSDDIELLLPMPFSAGQIVMAKLAVVSVFPIGLCVVLLNAVCLGFGIREGAGMSFIIGTVLSSILIPVTGIAAGTLLIVIIFRIFGFIRNRDITVALGGIFTFGFTIAYMYFSSKFRGEGSGEAVAAAFNAVSSVSMAFPNIYFMNRFMFEGSIPGLLISLAVTAVMIALALAAVRAFYLNSALSMQNTSTKKKALSEASLHKGKKNDVLKALTGYEAKSTRRNPAYMIYGFVMSFVWPVLFALPVIMGDRKIINGIVFPVGTVPALLAFMALGITASCFSCGFNILPGSAFSREGSSFSMIQALPVDFKDYYRSKRNFSMLVCSLGSVLYVVILGIVSVAAGFISIGNSWTILAGACACFFFNLTLINLMLLKNSAKPRFNWDSETEFARKLGLINVIAIVFGMIMLVVLIIALVLLPMLDGLRTERTILIVCAFVELILIILAFVVDHFAVRTASKNLMKQEL